MVETCSNLLLVDTEPESLFPTCQWLSEMGYRVVTAAGAQQALVIARKRRIGLVFVAETQRLGGGWALVDQLRQLRNQRPMPAILTTDSQTVDVLFRVRQGQPEYSLRTPLDIGGVATLIELLWGTSAARPITTVEVQHLVWPAASPSAWA